MKSGNNYNHVCSYTSNRLLDVIRVLIVLSGWLLCTTSHAIQANGEYDSQTALDLSQAAIGTKIADLSFQDTDGKFIQFSDFHGKPLLVSLIFTSCHLTCPVTTKQLELAVTAAQDALGADSFNIVTIGFDPARDTVDNMRVFAKQQRINNQHWYFLSASQSVIDAITTQLGFTYFPSPRGFDHITQVTVIDQKGVVYRQVYGDVFELPWLVEPLKELVFNHPSSERHLLSDLIAKVKFFCTVYNPNTGRYRIDYSLFIQILIGFFVILTVAIYLYREARQQKSLKG